MTCADPFLKASATFTDAIRHPFKSGDALQVFPSRSASRLALAILPTLIGAAAFLVVVFAVIGVGG
jgi:hypothetical protein